MPEPHFPPPTYFDFHQEPKPSEEEKLVDIFQDLFKKQQERLDAVFQSQAESIQRLTDQVRQLTENQNNIPQESFSNDTDEAFEYQSDHDDTLSEEEAEQY